MTKSDENLIRSVPQALACTDRICSSINVGSTKTVSYTHLIIENPDYVGVNPNENDKSIEFIKKYSKNVLVGVKLEKDEMCIRDRVLGIDILRTCVVLYTKILE